MKKSLYEWCIENNKKLLEEWHPTKNDNLTPHNVTYGSKKKVWWICKNGHEWQTAICDRKRGRGCPYCAKKKANNEHCLQACYSDIAKQWHPIKNGKLTPYDVLPSSNKKVWWMCEKGHEWQASINHRTVGRNCPYCSGRKVCIDNCLQTTHPEIAKQWHPIKNGNLTPYDVTTGSKKKVWWQCPLGHEWEASIQQRTRGRGCPVCKKENNSSFPEQVLFFYLKKYFDDTINRYKLQGKAEIDVFVPSLKFGIEYDGSYYHRKKEHKDLKKEKFINDNGVKLLRIKELEESLSECYIENNVIYCKSECPVSQLNNVVKLSFEYIQKNIINKHFDLDIDIERDRIKIYELFIYSEKKESLAEKYSDIAKEWHPTKNGSIKPTMVKPTSHKKVWWMCEKGHEWQSTITNRIDRHSGCPYCSNKKAHNENNLAVLFPELVKEWHPTKNGDLTPYDVMKGTSKNVWWQCKKGHEWQDSPNHRTRGRGCPYCSGRRVSKENSLQAKYPDIAKEWHPTKNGDLIPSNITYGSEKKVWWQCENGHEWQATIYNRTGRKSGCPHCAKEKRK